MRISFTLDVEAGECRNCRGFMARLAESVPDDREIIMVEWMGHSIGIHEVSSIQGMVGLFDKDL